MRINLKSKNSPIALIIPLIVAIAILWFSFFASLRFGVADISTRDLFQALTNPNGSQEHIIILTLRFPRAIIALLVGAGLAIAGSLMQGITRNPLADPSILGINSGAALAVVIGSMLWRSSDLADYSLFAFLGGTLSAIAVYFFASLGSRGVNPLSLTLAGSAITVFCSSVTSGILILNQRTLDEIRFWLAGSISSRELELVWQILPYFLIGIILSLVLARQITILSLGEETAQGLGINTLWVKVLTMFCVILLAGASVALAGPIGFIGLIMPHIVRFLVGNDYRWILPFSMIGGAILLLNADIMARLIIKPQEVPVGLILPIVGAPFFIYLIRKRIR